MEQITTRKALARDLETLRRFEQGVINAERPFDVTLKPADTYYYDLEKMLTDSHIEIVVAECSDKIIGSGYARIESAKLYLKHSQHAYLGFMYVEDEFRGKA